jgi:hypothetical protein
VCWRVLRLAAEEAIARDRRLRGRLGPRDRGPHPIRLLVEARGRSLDGLLAAVLDELDRDR